MVRCMSASTVVAALLRFESSCSNRVMLDSRWRSPASSSASFRSLDSRSFAFCSNCAEVKIVGASCFPKIVERNPFLDVGSAGLGMPFKASSRV